MRRQLTVFACLLLLSACQPDEQRPGLWLSGDVQPTLPDDWRFTNDHRTVHIEVSTPYLLPHSVTIWCTESDGNLFVGARAPDTKNWPGWVDDDPQVRLGIADRIYPVRLEPLSDPESIRRVAAAYAAKYDLPGGISGGEEVGQRYWRVAPRQP